MRARLDRDKAQREASRDRESLDLTDGWAYLVVGEVALIFGALIIDLVLGTDMHVVLSGGILAALAVGIFWHLRRIRKPRVNTVATLPLDAFYLEHRQCGDLDGGVENDRVSCGRLIARVMRTEMGLNSEERRTQP